MGNVAKTSRALARVESEVVEAIVVEGIVVEEAITEVNPGSPVATVGCASASRVDLLALLLENSRSKDTQRTYKAGWKSFFGDSPILGDLWGRDELAAVLEFCSWPTEAQRRECWEFQARLQGEKKSPATISLRASSIRSLLKLAHSLGLSQSDGAGLFPKVAVSKYRDTRGIPWEKARLLMKLPAEVFAEQPGEPKKLGRARKLKRLRDTAILAVFCTNGVRNSSLVRLNVEDFELNDLGLWIIEKRKAGQKRRLTISAATAEHVAVYLQFAGHAHDPKAALFGSLHRGSTGQRLTPGGVRDIVAFYGDKLGLTKKLFPHRLRHTAISKLGKETGGDVIAMQEFSGHADINTLMIYARQARDRQGDLTNLLSKLLED